MSDPKPKRTGTIHRYAPPKPGEPMGHYVVRCSAPDGTRPLFHLDPSPESPTARAAAQPTAEGITEQLWEQKLGATPARLRAKRRESSPARAIGGTASSSTVTRWGYARHRHLQDAHQTGDRRAVVGRHRSRLRAPARRARREGREREHHRQDGV